MSWPSRERGRPARKWAAGPNSRGDACVAPTIDPLRDSGDFGEPGVLAAIDTIAMF